MMKDRTTDGFHFPTALVGSFSFHVWVYFNSSVAMPT